MANLVYMEIITSQHHSNLVGFVVVKTLLDSPVLVGINGWMSSWLDGWMKKWIVYRCMIDLQ